MKNKFKNYSFWVGLSGAIIVLIEAVGKACGFMPDSEQINSIIMGIAGILVVLGVISAPAEEKKQSETEKETDETILTTREEKINEETEEASEENKSDE